MINLLPPDTKTARRYGRRNRTLRNYTMVVLAIGLSAASVMLFNSQLSASDDKRLREEITAKQQQVDKLKSDQEKLLKLANDLKTIEKLYDGEVVFSSLLPQIASLLPAGTVLNGLTLSGGVDDPLNLEIDMQKQEQAAVFQQNLVNSELFDAADIVSISSKGEGGTGNQYLFNATIAAKFKGSKKPTTNTETAEPAPTSEGAQ